MKQRYLHGGQTRTQAPPKSVASPKLTGLSYPGGRLWRVHSPTSFLALRHPHRPRPVDSRTRQCLGQSRQWQTQSLGCPVRNHLVEIGENEISVIANDRYRYQG